MTRALRRRILIAWCVAAAVVAWVPSFASAQNADGLHEGWQWRITIPEIWFFGQRYSPESRVRMWTEKGWLVVRRTTADDEIEWQVVLARATDPKRPAFHVNEASGAVEISYRNYLVRDNGSILRVYREPKGDDSPEWPTLTLEPWEHTKITMNPGSMQYRELDYWRWLIGGPDKARGDLWVRFRPTARNPREPNPFAPSGGFVTTGGNDLVEVFEGQGHAHFEKDLAIITRMPIHTAEQRALPGPGYVEPAAGQPGLRAAARAGADRPAVGANNANDPAPAFTDGKWLNVDKPIQLEQLKGKVPLVYFWATWSPASVNKLAALEALHQRFASRGLAVIGIHAAHKSEGALEAMKANGVTFPVMIDTGEKTVKDFVPGETVNRFKAEVLPASFLIDKSGKSPVTYLMGLPSVSLIGTLLFPGEVAPTLAEGKWFNVGEPVSLDNERGKVAVVVFWTGAGQVGPGRPSARDWAQLEALRNAETTVIGVYRPVEGEDVAKALKERSISLPVLVDGGETARRFAVDELPRYFMIDRNGKVDSIGIAVPTKARLDGLAK